MAAKKLSDLLWAFAQSLKRWSEDRGKAGQIIPGRDNDLLTFQIATEGEFEKAYCALLPDHGHIAEEIRRNYDAVKASLSVPQIDDPQAWAEGMLVPLRNLMVRAQLVAREMAADQRNGEISDVPQEWSRPMALTDLADRILKDPKKHRKLRALYGPDRLKQIGPKGSKSWQVRLDTLPANIRKEIERP